VLDIANIFLGLRAPFSQVGDRAGFGDDGIHQLAIHRGSHAAQAVQGNSVLRFRVFEFLNSTPRLSEFLSNGQRVRPSPSRMARSQPRWGRDGQLLTIADELTYGEQVRDLII